MIHGLQKTLTFLLILLQLVAPLVHAHTQTNEPYEGFHVPGLELMAMGYKTSLLQKNAPLSISKGIIISISSGIKQNNTLPLPSIKSASDITIHYFDENLNEFEVGFSPHLIALFSQHFSPSSSPRAPPFE